MKIMVVGGTGTLGKAVMAELAKRHTVVCVGHTSGPFQVDIKSRESIDTLFKAMGPVDAVVSAVGKVHFGDLVSMTQEEWYVGIHDKLMGQVNLVTSGLKFMPAGGSFTLTSGILSSDPIKFGASASMVNGAIDSFVKAAAIEMPNGMRINSVSPTVFAESMDQYGDYFPGFNPAPVARVARAYSKSVEGAQTGQIYTVW